MNNNLFKGKLKRWNDERGFGFIASEKGGGDIFVHISAFKRIGRRPMVGDVITYQILTDNDGKARALNARIEGVGEVKPKLKLEPKPVPKIEPIPKTNRKRVKKQRKRSSIPGVVFVVLVISLGSIAYNKFVMRDEVIKTPAVSISSHIPQEEAQDEYTCSGKVYCSEMTSCEEARFYLSNCPGTKLDGDRDGVPCERQWCSW